MDPSGCMDPTACIDIDTPVDPDANMDHRKDWIGYTVLIIVFVLALLLLYLFGKFDKWCPLSEDTYTHQPTLKTRIQRFFVALKSKLAYPKFGRNKSKSSDVELGSYQTESTRNLVPQKHRTATGDLVEQMRMEIDNESSRAMSRFSTHSSRQSITDEERRVPEGMLKGGWTDIEKPVKAKRNIFQVR
ncbi:hypothetical protein K491DRAFT_733427 [Lophiostoma macrostomum CBS 122681]|uniref:Uncharacterized protein n=1 Tax=Lophiostoma macrostomum CBS 122681 TaxID=1314788 RepID=A0A6A6SRN9_9PLEO|nr:hypothetical protein K491DRAFT_733427 [Lophiostoma macrostomum CBS 122681]